MNGDRGGKDGNGENGGNGGNGGAASFPPPSSSSSSSSLRWTYSQLHTAASALAAKLYHLGIRRGMRIATFLRNGAPYMIAFWAAAVLGCPLVSINATFASVPAEAQYMLGVAEASVVMVEDARMAEALDGGTAATLLREEKGMKVKVICSAAAAAASDRIDLKERNGGGWMSLEPVLAPSGEPFRCPRPKKRTGPMTIWHWSSSPAARLRVPKA